MGSEHMGSGFLYCGYWDFLAADLRGLALIFFKVSGLLRLRDLLLLICPVVF